MPSRDHKKRADLSRAFAVVASDLHDELRFCGHARDCSAATPRAVGLAPSRARTTAWRGSSDNPAPAQTSDNGYSQSLTNAYYTSCTSTGESPIACGCDIGYFEENVPVATFTAYVDQIPAPTTPTSWMLAAVAACGS